MKERFLCVFAASVGWLVWQFPWAFLTYLILTAVVGGLMLMLCGGLFSGLWIRGGERLPLPESDLERRRPLWNVLSELYLDTELDELDNERIAAILLNSGYDAGQLEEILYREVHPVLLWNLMSLAGEWIGFDLDWLEQEILRQSRLRCGVAIILGKWRVSSGFAALVEIVNREQR